MQEYLNGYISYSPLARKYHLPSKTAVEVWVKTYKGMVDDGLRRKRKSENYTLDFKLNIVKLYLSGEMPYQTIANEFKITNPAMICRWVKVYRKDDVEGLNNKIGRPSIMNLDKKN